MPIARTPNQTCPPASTVLIRRTNRASSLGSTFDKLRYTIDIHTNMMWLERHVCIVNPIWWCRSDMSYSSILFMTKTAIKYDIHVALCTKRKQLQSLDLDATLLLAAHQRCSDGDRVPVVQPRFGSGEHRRRGRHHRRSHRSLAGNGWRHPSAVIYLGVYRRILPVAKSSVLTAAVFHRLQRIRTCQRQFCISYFVTDLREINILVCFFGVWWIRQPRTSML
jgi:hypothetical protein